MKKFAGVIAGAILANGMGAALAGDIVAAKHIRAGSVISASDIETPNDVEGMRRASKLIGMEIERTVYKGQPLYADNLRPPTLIKRNAIVQMEFAKGSLVISTEGRAMEPGAFGQRIRVMNLSSKQIVSATITGVNNVKAKS